MIGATAPQSLALAERDAPGGAGPRARRRPATARGRRGNVAGPDLAPAEEAMLLSVLATARMLALMAEPHLPPGQRSAEQARRREERR